MPILHLQNYSSLVFRSFFAFGFFPTQPNTILRNAPHFLWGIAVTACPGIEYRNGCIREQRGIGRHSVFLQ